MPRRRHARTAPVGHQSDGVARRARTARPRFWWRRRGSALAMPARPVSSRGASG